MDGNGLKFCNPVLALILSIVAFNQSFFSQR
jgi:hypothetical protein